MDALIVRDMQGEDEYFVSACSHVHESATVDAVAARRMEWLRKRHAIGERVKVALEDNRPIGFLYLTPIEICPFGLLGEDLLAIPCLFVNWQARKKGAGKALLQAAVDEARASGRKGLATVGHYGGSWFMPAPFFERHGFRVAARQGGQAILWQVFDESARVPSFLTPDCHYQPIPQRIAADLFWNTFCGSGDRGVVAGVLPEFPGIILREHCADDPQVLRHYQIPRGLYIDGQLMDWDYQHPEAGVRAAFARATA